jgi:ribosomal protein S18 acetylase RimI-like enzyme
MQVQSPPVRDGLPPNIAVPCSEYTFDQLADVYNQARVDYIVPMPMNGKRMQEYVQQYDIDLTASQVALDTDDYQPNGICMLGIRGQRSWITRLGVVPARRRHKSGEFLTSKMVEISRHRAITRIQLEVIVGNEPALRLFEKLGFGITRELLIVRRPPSKEPVAPVPCDYHVIDDAEELIAHLTLRDDQPSWLEETASLMNTPNMRALVLHLPNGEKGWLAFQRTPFQLTHFVFSANNSEALNLALLQQLHHLFPLQDTKVENVPLTHSALGAFQQLGYVEAFRRYEMWLSL